MSKWTPKVGPHAQAVVERGGLDSAAARQTLSSAQQILGAGVNPASAKGSATGLVVGYVQSGKTLSFTTVIGLARDNGFPLVIVVAGNKTSLLDQSHERLGKDLDVDGGAVSAWIMARNPKAQHSLEEQYLRRAIDSWRDASLEEDEKPTVLLTVLKQNQRLASLTALLQTLDLTGVPTLVIDDEADQASLNTKVNQNDESTTYTRLCDLRDALPCHTFLQYTATPQAPLLINIADTLSPDFVHVLEPGRGYVGGDEFFKQRSRHVSTIPMTDIAMLNVGQDDPPPSLVQAMGVFFVGFAASLLMHGPNLRRSMLIHPGREKVIHQESAVWAEAIRDEWLEKMKLPVRDADRVELIEELKLSYSELLKTEKDLPPFDEVMGKMPRVLRQTTVVEFNTRGEPTTPKLKWQHSQGWILVGGQAVDRGLTVDSLSVTYMPRGVGVGNADSLQQRARFFGYKRKYFGLCRVYLEQALRTSFEDYVEHERIMRGELKGYAERGENLKTWRRRLILDAALKPCRRSVISDPVARRASQGGWIQQRGARMSAESMKANHQSIAEFTRGMAFKADRTWVSDRPAQQHMAAHDVALGKVLDFLFAYRCEDQRDTAAFTGVLLTLGEALRQNPAMTASIYRMRPKFDGARDIDGRDGSIETFMQGRSSKIGEYPGDGVFAALNQLTVQLHSMDLTEEKKVIVKKADLLALHVPRRLARDWLVQVQAGQ